MTNLSYAFLGRRFAQLRKKEFQECAVYFSAHVANDPDGFVSELFIDDDATIKRKKKEAEELVDKLRFRVFIKGDALVVELIHEARLLEILVAVRSVCIERDSPIRAIIWGALDDRMSKAMPYEILVRQNMSQCAMLEKIIELREKEAKVCTPILDTSSGHLKRVRDINRASPQ